MNNKTKRKTAILPEAVWLRVRESLREREDHGADGTFSGYVIEALEEKLDREKQPLDNPETVG